LQGAEGCVASASFDRFVTGDGERLRRVLVAQFGVEVGNEVHADALVYAWEHRDRLAGMTNPVGYLYRVARSASRRHRRWRRAVVLPVERRSDGTEPDDAGVHDALARLPELQRVCVVLVHVYDWSYRDAADALDVPVHTVRNHLHRGLDRLRTLLEESS
jgi:RNA polymerase sigma factor (sigma-70 family)